MDPDLDRLMAESLPAPQVSPERVRRLKAAVMARIDARAPPPAHRPFAFLPRLGVPAVLALALGVIVGLRLPVNDPPAGGLAYLVSTVYETSVHY